MIAKEWHAWPIGYGAMLLEGLVAIIAMVAAAALAVILFYPNGLLGQVLRPKETD